jgi:hypothetical protein
MALFLPLLCLDFLHFPRVGGFVWAGIFGPFVTTKGHYSLQQYNGYTKK